MLKKYEIIQCFWFRCRKKYVDYTVVTSLAVELYMKLSDVDGAVVELIVG